jgi:hypothetical protein
MWDLHRVVAVAVERWNQLARAAGVVAPLSFLYLPEEWCLAGIKE